MNWRCMLGHEWVTESTKVKFNIRNCGHLKYYDNYFKYHCGRCHAEKYELFLKNVREW
jgi:hypothetical protein